MEISELVASLHIKRSARRPVLTWIKETEIVVGFRLLREHRQLLNLANGGFPALDGFSTGVGAAAKNHFGMEFLPVLRPPVPITDDDPVSISWVCRKYAGMLPEAMCPLGRLMDDSMILIKCVGSDAGTIHRIRTDMLETGQVSGFDELDCDRIFDSLVDFLEALRPSSDLE